MEEPRPGTETTKTSNQDKKEPIRNQPSPIGNQFAHLAIKVGAQAVPAELPQL